MFSENFRIFSSRKKNISLDLCLRITSMKTACKVGFYKPSTNIGRTTEVLRKENTGTPHTMGGVLHRVAV